MRKSYVILSILLVIGLLFTACQATPAPTTTPAPTGTSPSPTPTTALPKLLTWSSLDVGSSTYAHTAGAGESVREKFGVPVRVVPVGSDVGRLTLARTGMVDMVTLTAAAYQAREGVSDFASRAWGPQPLRMLYQLTGGTANGLFVKGDSGIKTPKDLKGKKIPFVVGLSSHNQEVEAVLAFGGLTWDDVIKVELPSYGASSDAILEGKTDAFYGATNSSSTIKIAATPGGIFFLPLPRADKEGWKRYNAISPAALPATTTEGPGLSESNPYEGTSQAQVEDAYDFLDDDIAYFTTKVWAECFPLYKDKGGRLIAGEIGHVLDIVGTLRNAWHPGSIRYFKEIGKWTPEMETWNNKVLDREDKLMKAWEATLAEMDAKQLKESELSALWDQYRKNIPMVE